MHHYLTEIIGMNNKNYTLTIYLISKEQEMKNLFYYKLIVYL